jgi:hypothetical protein
MDAPARLELCYHPLPTLTRVGNFCYTGSDLGFLLYVNRAGGLDGYVEGNAVVHPSHLLEAIAAGFARFVQDVVANPDDPLISFTWSRTAPRA